MIQGNPYWPKLESDLSDTSGIIVPKDQDAQAFYEKLRQSIRDHATEPRVVSAKVIEPGFKHRELGSTVTGYLLSKANGYWLVLEPNERQYYCFWGTEENNLGAYGVSGNPLYCWWD